MIERQNTIGHAVAVLRSDRPLLIVLALSLAVRLAYAALLLSDPVLSSVRGLDSLIYLSRARDILAGDWLGSGPIFYSGIVYPYLLALLGASFSVIVIVQMVLDTAATGLVYALARRVAGNAGAVAAGLLHALSAVLVFAAGTVLYDPWTTFCVLLSVHAAVRAAETGSSASWALSGLSIGLAATARPFVLAFGPLVLAAWYLPVLRPQRRDLAAGAAAIVIGIVLALAPAAVRNGIATGNPLPFPEGGGLAFYIGNNPLADGTFWAPSHLGIVDTVDSYAATSRSYPSRRMGREVSAGEASAFWFREGLQFWQEMPQRAFALTGRKVALLFNRAEVSDNYDLSMFRTRIALLRWLPDSLVILSLGLLGAALLVRRWRTAGPVLLMIGVLVLFIPVFWVSARFRYPLIALFTVTGGAAVRWVGDAVRAKKGGRIAGWAAGFAACLALVIWPLELRPTDTTQQLALAHLEAGNDGEALTLIDGALARAESAHLFLLRARILLRMGRIGEARRSLEKSVDLERRLESAHSLLETVAAAAGDPEERTLRQAADLGRGGQQAMIRLGQYYLERKRYVAAIKVLEGAAAGGSPDAMFSLGLAYLLKGMPHEAAAVFERLDRKRPGDPNVLVNLGFAYLDAARYDDAERVFRATLGLGGQTSLARYGLGLTFKLSGRIEQAREQFRLFLSEVPPESYWGRRARQNLVERQ